MIRSWPTKDTDSRLPFWFDFTAWLAVEGRGAIASYAVAIDEGDAALLISDVALGTGAYAGYVLCWLSGGTDGATYLVRCRITLADGTVEDASRYLTIAPH